MFIDKATVHVKAGNGGNGCVSFRREKYISHGGPDGGDGGKGGNIVFVVDSGLNTLLDFKYRRKFIAKNGEDGKNRKFFGAAGEDLEIKVPSGTVIKDPATGEVIHDMSDGLPYIAAKGGRGGWGNVHFATPTRQAPRFAKSGTEGEEFDLLLELKLLADVGLAGYPNVGKSTLLSRVSAARPKIANYHFTTLSPNLGVCDVHGKSFVMADIPGLIEGAADGVGLGHDFLRHIERCRLVVHMFDISASEREDPLADIIAINKELQNYSADLALRPQILAANKADAGYDDDVLTKVKDFADRNNCQLYLISAYTGEGIDALMNAIAAKLAELPPLKTFEPTFVRQKPDVTSREVTVKRENNIFHVEGEWLQRIIADTNFGDYESLSHFQRILRNEGVIDALEKAGIQEEDTVEMYGLEFDFYY